MQQDLGNRTILLARMDKAFSDYSHEAEKLSVLLAEPADAIELEFLSQPAEAANRRSHRLRNVPRLRDELFALINPPAEQDRPKSSVN